MTACAANDTFLINLEKLGNAIIKEIKHVQDTMMTEIAQLKQEVSSLTNVLQQREMSIVNLDNNFKQAPDQNYLSAHSKTSDLSCEKLTAPLENNPTAEQVSSEFPNDFDENQTDLFADNKNVIVKSELAEEYNFSLSKRTRGLSANEEDDLMFSDNLNLLSKNDAEEKHANDLKTANNNSVHKESHKPALCPSNTLVCNEKLSNNCASENDILELLIACDDEQSLSQLDHLNASAENNSRISSSPDKNLSRNKKKLDIPIYIPKRLFSCVVCSRRFVHKHELIRHKQTHKNSASSIKRFSLHRTKPLKSENKSLMKFQCRFCMKLFQNNSSYQSHLSTHTSSMTYGCLLCHKTFSSKDSLKSHMYLHTGEKLFSCSVCSQKFKRRHDLSRHLYSHSDSSVLVCKYCSKRFTTSTDLKYHEQLHEDKTWHTCKYCNKIFETVYALRNHEKIHTGEKPFACPLCKKCFSRNASVKRHLKCHSQEENFELRLS